MVDGKHALVVVACVAGFGAFAGSWKQEAGDAPIYAAELFGPGSDERKITYPTCAVVPGGATCAEGDTNKPWVKLTFVGDQVDDDPGATGMVTFMLSEGAQFATAVGSGDIDVGGDNTGDARVTNVSDGAAGDSSVTFELSGGFAADDTFTFIPPALKNLSALANPSKMIQVSVSTVSTAGAGFPHNEIDLFCGSAPSGPPPAGALADGYVTGTVKDGTLTAYHLPLPTPDQGGNDVCDDKTGANTHRAKTIVKSADAVKLTKTSMDAVHNGSVRISLEDREMLVGQSPALASAPDPLNPHTYNADGKAAAQLAKLMLSVTTTSGGVSILQWDGTVVDYALAGSLRVVVSGDFGADDMVFVNWNDPANWWDKRAVDGPEGLVIAGNTAATERLSIDPDDNPNRPIGIYYIPGGKDKLAHGSMLKATAQVVYTPSTALNEKPVHSTTELRFHGVAGALQAYAIPFDGNGKGDKANVRIRCEEGDVFSEGAQCRVFLECWDDMGMRSFGESAMIDSGGLDTLNSMEIEEVVGIMDASSRHSCRVLATGRPSVQTLVRDGSSGTLVNNSYVTN